MKETVLRIFHSSEKDKEPIQGVSRRTGECSIFHCGVRNSETLLQEDLHCGQVVSLRIRQLSNPPPDIFKARDSYKTVSKLEISSPVDVTWVFSVCSILPALSIIRFGSSCFEFPFDCPPTSDPRRIAKCSSMKELIISFDHRKLLVAEFDTKRAIQTINLILEYSTKYFSSLAKADLYVPFGAKLDDFIRKNPLLAQTGEIQELFKVGAKHFQSFAYTDKSKKVPELLRRDSSGSEPMTVLPQLAVKRTRSDTDFSSEADEDWEDAPPPSRTRTYAPLSPGRNSHTRSNDYRPTIHQQHAHISAIPDHSAAYYRQSRNGVGNGYHQDSDHDTTTSPSTYESPPYSDFSQMYTRR